MRLAATVRVALPIETGPLIHSAIRRLLRRTTEAESRPLLTARFAMPVRQNVFEFAVGEDLKPASLNKRDASGSAGDRAYLGRHAASDFPCPDQICKCFIRGSSVQIVLK